MKLFLVFLFLTAGVFAREIIDINVSNLDGSEEVTINFSGGYRGKISAKAIQKAWADSIRIISFDTEHSIRIVSASETAVELPVATPAVEKSAAPAVDPDIDRLYGITKDGKVFIAAELIEAVEGGDPKVMVFPDWAKHKMTKSGRYFTFQTGKKFAPSDTAVYCFSIGGGSYLPHNLDRLSDLKILEKINFQDRVDNGVGGYNFATLPVNFPETK